MNSTYLNGLHISNYYQMQWYDLTNWKETTVSNSLITLLLEKDYCTSTYKKAETSEESYFLDKKKGIIEQGNLENFQYRKYT